MAGNSPFWGIVFCNLGTSKTVILKFVTTVNIVTPYLSFFWYQYLHGIRYSRYRYFLVGLVYCMFPNTFLRFCGISFFDFFCGNSFFLKRGLSPPLLRKKGASANFLRGSRQSFETENTDRVFLRYRYGKYREIPTDTDQKNRLGMQL